MAEQGLGHRCLSLSTTLGHIPQRTREPGRHQRPVKDSRHFSCRRYFLIPKEGTAGIMWRKLWHWLTLDLWEKINWHQTGKSLALGNLGEVCVISESQSIYWTDSVLMQSSGDRGHWKVEMELLAFR